MQARDPSVDLANARYISAVAEPLPDVAPHPSKSQAERMVLWAALLSLFDTGSSVKFPRRQRHGITRVGGAIRRFRRHPQTRAAIERSNQNSLRLESILRFATECFGSLSTSSTGPRMSTAPCQC